MQLRHLIITAVFLATLSDSALADRQDRRRGQEQHESQADKKPKREMSLDEAVQMVQRRYDARVIRAETKRQNDRTIYRLKLLNKEGRVWTVTVDAATGKVK